MYNSMVYVCFVRHSCFVLFIFIQGMSFSGREFDGLTEEEQREACRTAR